MRVLDGVVAFYYIRISCPSRGVATMNEPEPNEEIAIRETPLPMTIVVSCYDGGGIDVSVQNYRPLGMHIRVLDPKFAGEVVGGMIEALVTDWAARQHLDVRIRTV